MHHPPSPDARELLPPLLACLPTAFLSPQPPPALLPALAPILRQRVAFMSTSEQRTEHGWLPLLQWDPERAAKLPEVVERIQLEPHPVSGELELDDVRPAKYRRLDDETLHARLEVEQFELLPVFVWCEEDEHGQTGPGWKLAELRTLEDHDDGAEWFASIPEANDATNTHSIAVPHASNGVNGHQTSAIPAEADEQEEEDDGSYWAAYDRTPGARTPAATRSPAPLTNNNNNSTNRQRTQSELEYFNRYGDVQPAMDGHDPDEEMPEHMRGESTLNGQPLNSHAQPPQPSSRSLHPLDTQHKLNGAHDSAVATALTQSLSGADALSMPRPISPASSTHSSIDRLEEQAQAMSASASASATTTIDAEKGDGRVNGDDRAQAGIKQHISTDIKSLFRLARSVGMERGEFVEVVGRELGVLGMFERDD
ncbi:hypothetical protein LTR91_004231 [Friedmanniomyces endolithicus]|uniref:Uncharacterized protein n=1 Tax=Friedmanniomyces endolithicus TaxID=329885 RepID=A0AAN6KW76_9PEZI|nr:hypothetical protein LTR94_009989 [Friedmanniomyces endolithicus]KAK0794369.1 hypothetical protein LTR75_010884 [Friedmanniomyces endolithicus]KAK0795357.1 hypothetical protein LTR59_007468 [Friedmanniomyces endolithicus]KAK0801691.1 hypothetical protein LTR38_006732 [Friedmanniomyces endolithicus]KAK0847919.1 hypothetical protein LTR03_006045 [Friedmanniomyces endolithicus]